MKMLWNRGWQFVRLSPGSTLPQAEGAAKGEMIVAEADGNGKGYVRASVCNGYPHPRVLSCLEVEAEGFASKGLDPYSFVSAALHDREEGGITPGNEHGVAFDREGFSAVGFSAVDFGRSGSDTLTLPVFALDDEAYEICLWDGMPRKGGKLLAGLPYQKKSIWNVYQEETWRLPRVLTGMHELWFSMERKIHLKGFVFETQYRGLRWHGAVTADQIYGDSYRLSEDGVKDIGNNVTLVFEEMDFPDTEDARLTLEGRTPLVSQAVTVRIHAYDGAQQVSMCAFERSEDPVRRTFPVTLPGNRCRVEFVFLPGSSFDFYGFGFTVGNSAKVEKARV